MTVKTDRPWRITWPGDTFPRTVRVGTEVPDQLYDQALHDRVIPPPRPLRVMLPGEAEAALGEMFDHEVMAEYCLALKKPPAKAAKREAMIDEILGVLFGETADPA